jgi:hypothetical protein
VEAESADKDVPGSRQISAGAIPSWLPVTGVKLATCSSAVLGEIVTMFWICVVESVGRNDKSSISEATVGRFNFGTLA